MEPSPPLARDKIKTSLKLGMAEGAISSPVLSISENFVIPFGLVLKATSFQIALLGAVPGLLAALLQLFTPLLIRRTGSRKRVLQLSCLLSSLAWVGVLLVPYIFQSSRVWLMLAFAALVVIFYNLPNAAWGSWITDLVPSRRRGRYLGQRSSIGSFVATGIVLAAGFFLDIFSDRPFMSFAAIFAVASAGRLISLALFSFMYEPSVSHGRSAPPNMLRFLADLPHNNLGHFLLYSFLLNFGTYVSSAFFAVYQLKELGFSYTTYIVLSVISGVATVVAMWFWGGRSDRWGIVKVLRIGVWGVPLVPILWIFSSSIPYLIFLEVFGGIVWAAVTLCSLNFVYEASTPENRPNNIANFYALNGVALFLGGVTGGLLLPHLPALAGSSILTIFLISGLIRFGAAAFFTVGVKESRRMPEPPAEAEAKPA